MNEKYISDFINPSVRPELVEGWTETFSAESSSKQPYLKFALFLNYQIGKDDSRKGAKAPSSENLNFEIYFASWRLGAINFLELVLFNI